ncbi:MAG: DUF4331 domain-containing protein [Actinobacteria bacterium]|nr:MAG: DUF4331 domain-containing protein [Actinomycetota bacterium]
MHPSLATVRKPILAAAALGVFALALLLILTRAQGPSSAFASSHAEAPLISQDPRADNTDLYAFVSPDHTNTVTMIANYIPLESPASGPNFYSFDDTVLYEIKVDNSGDGRPDLAYQFHTFLYNTGPITTLGDSSWNRPQTYSVTLVHFNKNGQPEGKGKVLGQNIPTPPDNIGPRSTPNYNSLAAAAVTSLPGGIKVFAGQRDDPFFVDLGSIFDLAGLRPFNPFHVIPITPDSPGRDALKNDNVHSIEIQVPASQLVSFSSPTIGIYASASRQKVRILDDNGKTQGHGPWVQVSRLGNPLINEVVIPLGQKDYWNREDPANDQQFESFYTNPEVSRLENALYGTLPQGHAGGALQAIDATGRSDLVTILLTGIPGVNFTGSTDSDLLRLNTAITPGINGACPAGTASSAAPDRLGPLGPSGDLCGYPNGRRLGDDVIDIDLRAFAQGYGAFLHTALGLQDKTPNDLLGDGVDSNDVSFSGTFPYVAAPHQGYEVP